MLAATVIYVYAGSSVPNLQSLADQGISAVFTPSQLTQIIAAFVLLAAFPLLARFVMHWFIQRKRKLETSEVL
jgi:hypothetical protein